MDRPGAILNQCQTRAGGSVPWGRPPPWSSSGVGSAHFWTLWAPSPGSPQQGPPHFTHFVASPFLPASLPFPGLITHILYLNHILVSGSALGKPINRASLVAQSVKNPPAMQEPTSSAGDPDRSLCREGPLEKEMATHSSILAWEIPGMEEPGGLKSMRLPRVGYDLATKPHHTCRQRPWK